MAEVTIIIVGGGQHDNISNNTSDYTLWNNDQQASYNDMMSCLANYNNIVIRCVDPDYPSTINNNIIPFFQDTFKQTYLEKDSKNIIIDFAHLDYTNNLTDEIEDYEIAILEPGCMWNNGFPLETITNIIEYRLYYHPIINNFTIPYLNTTQISASNLANMDIYLIGQYRFFGPIIWKNNKQYDINIEDNVEINLDEHYQALRSTILEYLQDSLDNINDEAYVNFIGGDDSQYNRINYDIRKMIHMLIYGITINI